MVFGLHGVYVAEELIMEKLTSTTQLSVTASECWAVEEESS